ncbi:MAG: HAD-IIIC family phosphatase [Pseudomonadota bacterium]
MTTENSVQNNRERKVKCVVWDLDNTLWDGVLLESDQVFLRDGVTDIIKTLDKRGILQSIASKNEYDHAMTQLKAFGLSEYFIYPQINWNSKAQNIETIAKEINIGIDTLAFIDDQPFERDEVNFSLPEVFCIDAAEIDKVLELPEMNPRFLTDESSRRRLMYISDIARQKVEDHFVGPKEEFLATLKMVLTVAPAKEEDLKRAEELTVRTHQLNTTGYTYSYEELDQFRQSDRHILLIAGLDDKYGTYGKIGVILIECFDEVWTIKLLLMSCRVMSRGVGSVVINHIRNEARKKGVRLQAEFLSNERNRMMYMTYKFAHFKEKDTVNELLVMENDLSKIQKNPEYLTVKLT